MIGILKTQVSSKPQDASAIASINQLTNTSINTCLFCDNISDEFIGQIKTNILHRTNVSYFKGILITDELLRGQDLLTTSYAKKRFIYLYNLDWNKITPLRFANLANVLLHDYIDLIVQDEKSYQIVEQLFKAPKYIMKDWDTNTLIEIDNNE